MAGRVISLDEKIRKAFGDRKPALVDYMLWSLRFVTKSEYVDL